MVLKTGLDGSTGTGHGNGPVKTGKIGGSTCKNWKLDLFQFFGHSGFKTLEFILNCCEITFLSFCVLSFIYFSILLFALLIAL